MSAIKQLLQLLLQKKNQRLTLIYLRADVFNCLLYVHNAHPCKLTATYFELCILHGNALASNLLEFPAVSGSVRIPSLEVYLRHWTFNNIQKEQLI